MALTYHPFEARIMPLEALSMAPPEETEREYRALWRTFYRTVAIRERYNPRCRMNHMPKHFWDCMTEFQSDPVKSAGSDPCPEPQTDIISAKKAILS